MGVRVNLHDDQHRRDRGSCAIATFLLLVCTATLVWAACAITEVITHG
jgi:hypothetical protein